MEYGFYHPDRGYWQTNSTPLEDVLALYPKGTVKVPLKPSALHNFDGDQWVAPTPEELNVILAAKIRAQRNYLLTASVDPLVSNQFRWDDLTPDQQDALKDYRRALLDVPQQEGFPQNVIWPEIPVDTGAPNGNE